MRNPVTLLFLLLLLALFVLSRAPLSLVPSRSRAPLSRAHAHSDSQNCQRQRKLSQPLMVFERGRSDAKDERIHAGQITILPLSRQTGYSCCPASSRMPVSSFVATGSPFFLLHFHPLRKDESRNRKDEGPRLSVNIRDIVDALLRETT